MQHTQKKNWGYERTYIEVHIAYAAHTYPHTAICLYTCPHTCIMNVLILLYVCEDSYTSMQNTHNIVVYSAQIYKEEEPSQSDF